MSSKSVTVVVPAYNEAETIASVVADLQRVADSIAVVDDGSTDETAALAREAGAEVVEHGTNQGYDRALSNGMSHAAESGADIAVTFDADGQHDAGDIRRVVKPIQEGSAAIVVGRRPKPARPAERLFGQYTAWRLGITDPLSGFKAYDVDVYREIGYFDRFSSIGTHLMVAAFKSGYIVEEIDISISEREDEPRFGHLRANWVMLKALGRILSFDVRTMVGFSEVKG